MMQQAKEVVVLADASKLGRAEQIAWSPLPPRWVLVTDAGASGSSASFSPTREAHVIVAGVG